MFIKCVTWSIIQECFVDYSIDHFQPKNRWKFVFFTVPELCLSQTFCPSHVLSTTLFQIWECIHSSTARWNSFVLSVDFVNAIKYGYFGYFLGPEACLSINPYELGPFLTKSANGGFWSFRELLCCYLLMNLGLRLFPRPRRQASFEGEYFWIIFWIFLVNIMLYNEYTHEYKMQVGKSFEIHRSNTNMNTELVIRI